MENIKTWSLIILGISLWWGLWVWSARYLSEIAINERNKDMIRIIDHYCEKFDTDKEECDFKKSIYQ